MSPKPYATLAVLAILSSPVAAELQVPSSEELAAWDAKFLPGLYERQDFQVDVQTRVPKPLSENASQQCLGRADLDNLARAPVIAFLVGKCQPHETTLDASSFLMRAMCTEHSKAVAVQIVVSLSDDASTINIQTMRANMPDKVKGKSKKQSDVVITSILETTMARLGDCPNH
jgi:hypothetical protein